jgi:hypothetical protein
VASRLARASSAPDDFQGAHSVLGSASHSGFGSEPAIVVGNSMSASRNFDLDVYLPRLPSRVYMFVMAGLVPAIHVFFCRYAVKTWMPGTRPGMTISLRTIMP